MQRDDNFDGHVTTWNMPLLEDLCVDCVITKNSLFNQLANKFPRLKLLTIACETTSNLIIANFPCLEILSLSTSNMTEHKEDMNGFISNMPMLREFNFGQFAMNQISFCDVPLLTMITASFGTHSLNALIFKTTVPNLVLINLGFQEYLSILDPFNNVLWNKISHLQFSFGTCSMNVCQNLKNIENLSLITNEINDKTNCIEQFPWFQFKQLSTLTWTFPSAAGFQHFIQSHHALSSLVNLHLQWETTETINLQLLLKFSNLQTLELYGHGKSTNLQSLFELPQLKNLHMVGIEISKKDARLLKKWRGLTSQSEQIRYDLFDFEVHAHRCLHHSRNK